MTEFEDNLWREMEGAYGSELSDADGPLHVRSRLRTPVIAGTSLGVVSAGAAAVIVLTAGSAAPAFAVTSHRDGTVSVVIRRVEGIPGANQRLAQLGIRARAVQVAFGCQARVGRPVAGVPVMTLATGRHESRVTATPGAIHAQIRPAKIPSGRTLVIPAVHAGAVVRLVHPRIVNGAIPKCLLPAVQVRTAAASGTLRTISCHGQITMRPVPVIRSTANNTTNTNPAGPPTTVTEVGPAPAPEPPAGTGTATSDQTATSDSSTMTNSTSARAAGHAGPATVKLPAPLAALRACRLAAQAAAK
jgi:hypothetical protein